MKGSLAFIIALVLAGAVAAIDYQLDPCAAPTTITENATHFRMTGGCFVIDFPRDASQLISFYDTYNKKSFALKLYSIKDRNVANPNQAKTYAFEDVSTIISHDASKVYYSMQSGKIVASYSIDHNKVKAGLAIHNFVSSYPSGKVELRTRIMKDPMAAAHFTSLPAIVDGVEQPLVVNSEINGVNEFFVQELFTGSSFLDLIIDPLYTVDYSPIPAQHLQSGNVTASADGQFATRSDITAGVSDNNTLTQYATFTYTNYTSTNQSTGTISPSTSSGGWTSPNNAYADGGSSATATASLTGYWAGYAFGIPSDANITDITVRLDASKAVPSGTIYIGCVNLSWNNGTSYTSCQSVPALTNAEVTYNLTGLWGRTWTADELNNNFRVQVTTSSGSSTVSLDWLPVTVTYTRPLQNYSNGNAISGKWSVTYSSVYQYFLRVYKTSSGNDTMTIFAYNSTNTTSATSVTRTISGTGWLNLNVTSLVQYMTTTLGLNYTAFRFYTNLPQNFSEEVLRKETNDTTPPTINLCTFNQTTIYCNGSARLSCDVTDNLDVDSVLFDINSTNYSTTRATNTFSYILSPVGTTTHLGVNYQWNKAHAIDIMGNTAIGITNLTFIYSCCVPNWVENAGTCLTNDSKIKTYTDTNSCGSVAGLPSDNGTSIYCNYCSQDLEKTYLTGCNITGQRTYDWHDNNVFSCCFLTGLVSDCSIHYSPYNTTNTENCTVLQNDFEIDLDVELQFGFGVGGLASDKAFGKIWLNDTNNTYACVTYVKTDTGEVVQTNPPYTKRTDSTIALTQKEIEDREFFVTQNGLANVYWTNHNLVIDGRQYIFGVECSGNGRRLISEQISTVGYKAVNEPITRWFWVKENIFGITLFLLGGIIIIAVALFMYNRWKYG